VGCTRGGFCQQIKWLAKVATTSPFSQMQFDSRKLSKRRFSGGSCFANSICAFRASSKLDALVQIRLIGRSQALDLAQTAVLLLAPLVRHFLEEGRIDEAVELWKSAWEIFDICR
jgi:hypothetical protein